MAPSLDKNKTNCINPCGYMTMTGVIEKNGIRQIITARMYCKRWSCPECGPRRAWMYQQQIAKRAIEFNLDRLMTITLDPKRIKGDPYKHLNESWRKLREAFRRKFGQSVSYIAITEEHKSGYPHKHILIDHFIHQGWLSGKWERLGGGPIVDVRKIRDMKNMVRYVGKYLTKDILLSAPKGTRRVTCSQTIKLRDQVSEGDWTVSDVDLEKLYEFQKGRTENVVTDKNGRLRSYETISNIDLSHWDVPNDRPRIQEGDRERFPEFDEHWELIATYEKEEKQDETGSSLCTSIEQGTAYRWVFNTSTAKAVGGLFPRAWLQNSPGFRGCRNSQTGWTAII